MPNIVLAELLTDFTMKNHGALTEEEKKFAIADERSERFSVGCYVQS